MPSEITPDVVRRIVEEELAKFDPKVREDARVAAQSAATETGVIEKIAGTGAFREAVRTEASSYVRSGSAFALVVAAVAALPMIIPYCSSQEALKEAKAAASEASGKAREARNQADKAALGASSAAAQAQSAMADAKQQQDNAKQEVQNAIDKWNQGVDKFKEGLDEKVKLASQIDKDVLQRALDFQREYPGIADTSSPDKGYLCVGDTLVCWGRTEAAVVKKAPHTRYFRFDFKIPFESSPVVANSVDADSAGDTWAVYKNNVNGAKYEGWLLQSADKKTADTKPTVTVGYIAVGKVKPGAIPARAAVEPKAGK